MSCLVLWFELRGFLSQGFWCVWVETDLECVIDEWIWLQGWCVLMQCILVGCLVLWVAWFCCPAYLFVVVFKRVYVYCVWIRLRSLSPKPKPSLPISNLICLGFSADWCLARVIWVFWGLLSSFQVYPCIHGVIDPRQWSFCVFPYCQWINGLGCNIHL